MSNLINETQTIKYRVQVDGIVLNESLSKSLAEQFVSSLLPDQRSKAVILPITESGSQVLLG